jgi:hypothetical protein
MKTVKIKILLLLLLVVVIFTGIYSCQKEASGNTNPDQPHTVTIYLTDHQTPIFDSVYIDLQKLEVKVEDDSAQHGGWIDLAIRPGIYNILRFRNGLDTLFATGTLPNARLRKIRLTLGTQNTAVLNSQVFPLRVKDEDRQVVVDLEAEHFEITPAGAVLFWIDFDAGNSIQADNSGSGNNNGYRLRSHLRIFTRSHSGRIEGKVFPRAANPIIKAVIGTDTATALPDGNGEFKIVGLNAGNYTVLFDGQNGYRDTVINNVVVRNREDTHLSPVTLHQ